MSNGERELFFSAHELRTERFYRCTRYDPSNVYTEDGALVIELTKEPNSTSHGLGCKLSHTLAFPLAVAHLNFSVSQTSVV